MDVTELEPFTKIKCVQCGAGLVVPKRLAQFMLLSPMGSGGMGAVYRAIDTSLNRQVAIKLLQRDLAEDPNFIENFSREARAAAALNHHNIAQIYSFGQENGQYYLAMELVDRGSLHDIIAGGKPLTEAQVLEIGLQIAAALRSAWQRGLMHQDIKPANILFNEEGTAKIVDFGLAQFAESSKQAKKTSVLDGIWGTPEYIAPEKLEGKREDFRSDIYCLGATLFHALTGRPPFEGADPNETAQRRVKEAAPSVRKFRADVSEVTARILARMLAQKPENRFESYDALISDLTAAKRAALIGHRKVGEAREDLRRIQRGQRIKRFAAAAVTVALLIVLVQNRDGVTAFLAQLPVLKNLVARDAEETGESSHPTPPPPANRATRPLAPSPAAIDEWQNRFGETLDLFASGNYAPAADAARSLLATAGLPNKNLTIFFLGLSFRLRGLADESAARFEALAGDQSSAQIPKNPTLDNMPLAMALLMLDQLDERRLATSLKELPSGPQQFARFSLGVKNLDGGEREQAAAIGYFNEFLLAPPAEGDWAWLERLRPAAQRYCAEYRVLQTALAEAQQARHSENWEAAIARLDPAQIRPPLLTAGFAARAAAHRKELETELAGHRAAQAERLAALAEEEKRAIVALDAQAAPLLAAYHFGAAAALYEKIADQISTSDGKELLERKLTTCRLLAEMKKHVVEAVANRLPMPGGALTIGGRPMPDPLARADDTQAYFKTQFGETAVQWQRFPPEEFAKVCRYYLTPPTARANAETRAAASRRHLALALFYREMRLSATEAQQLANAAFQMDPGQRDLIRRTFGTVD